MAASAFDLLANLDAHLDDLETITMIPGSIPRVLQEWGALARASLQLLWARPRPPNANARRLEALLDSLAATPGDHPLPPPGTALMAITTTIGCTAEVMRTRIVTSPAARDQVDDAIRASLEAALARAARWTQLGFQTVDGPPDPRIVRLAGIDAVPYRSPALHAWRSIGPTDPGIDGAVSRWEAAAREAITSPHTVTQLALQLTSADIALLCASTSTVIQRAIQSGALPRSQVAVAALDAAEMSWRESARWPRELRLGGRATELRPASAALRQCLDHALRTGDGWKTAEELFTDTRFEQHIASLHSGLQAGLRVGRQVVAAVDDVTHGTSRVWLDTSRIPMSARTEQARLDAFRYDWRPNLAARDSAETLNHNARDAVARLGHATPLTIEALAARRSLIESRDTDEGPWETVPTILDPLRAAQDQARLAMILPTCEPTHTIGR